MTCCGEPMVQGGWTKCYPGDPAKPITACTQYRCRKCQRLDTGPVNVIGPPKIGDGAATVTQ